MVRNCAPENLEIPGLVLAHHPGMTVFMNALFKAVIASAAKQSISRLAELWIASLRSQ
jgi:hypothetical protein